MYYTNCTTRTNTKSLPITTWALSALKWCKIRMAPDDRRVRKVQVSSKIVMTRACHQWVS